MQQSDEDITAALVARLTDLTKRQARNAILHGTRKGLIKWVAHGRYQRITAGAA